VLSVVDIDFNGEGDNGLQALIDGMYLTLLSVLNWQKIPIRIQIQNLVLRSWNLIFNIRAIFQVCS